jgi:hypothetical protein
MNALPLFVGAGAGGVASERRERRIAQREESYRNAE